MITRRVKRFSRPINLLARPSHFNYDLEIYDVHKYYIFGGIPIWRSRKVVDIVSAQRSGYEPSVLEHKKGETK